MNEEAAVLAADDGAQEGERKQEGAGGQEGEGPEVQQLAAQEAAARELAEHNALADVFDDVRAQSAQSALVEPGRWPEIGLVPVHLDAEEFEMLVYEYLEDERADRAEAEAVVAPVYRTATRAVGVPRAFGSAAGETSEATTEAEAEGSEAAGEVDDAPLAEPAEVLPEVDEALGAASPASMDEAATANDNNPFAGLDLPAGYCLVEMEGEYVLVPDEEAEPVERTIDCASIVALVGAHSYYLYDKSIMTDAYAHWAFLAAEDNNVVTFVDCVREDSRVYPRPLAASSLGNAPFNMAEDVVAQTWDIVRESGAYPDIQQTVASNGDVYYFSTEYLSPTYAASLAEWDAVERKMHL